jgi:hypothetical protein
VFGGWDGIYLLGGVIYFTDGWLEVVNKEMDHIVCVMRLLWQAMQRKKPVYQYTRGGRHFVMGAG